jgi:hypothetical protein
MDSDDQFRSKSLLLYYYELEKEEILRHKWLESEKAGRDVGLEWATIDWVVKHRAAWRRSLKCPSVVP